MRYLAFLITSLTMPVAEYLLGNLKADPFQIFHSTIPANSLSLNKNIAFAVIFFFPAVLWPHAGHGPLILEVSRSHTTTHHSR